jgi:hypothetical protein
VGRLLSTFLLASLLAVAPAASAQDKPAASGPSAGERVSPIGKFILDAFRSQGNRTLCSVGDLPVSKFEERVLQELGAKAGDSVGQDQIEKALWKVFPCPFSPYRPELIPASAKDLEGAWLYPHESQPYRYGALSPLQPKTAAEAVSCEVIGFYAGGEMRTGRIPGANAKCPFQMASDLDPARKRPRTQNWAIGTAGQLKVTRTDQKDYVEEWDVFQVTKTFQALNMEIRAGDLVAYKRREKGLDPNVSTEFLHLQRLP